MKTKKCPEGKQPYAVYVAGKSGWKLRCAESEQEAMRRVRGAIGARLMRPSSYWQEQRELGLYPKLGARRRGAST